MWMRFYQDETSQELHLELLQCQKRQTNGSPNKFGSQSVEEVIYVCLITGDITFNIL